MKKIAVTALVLTLGLAACHKNDADDNMANETAVENAADADVNAATTSADNALDAAGNSVENGVEATGNVADATGNAIANETK